MTAKTKTIKQNKIDEIDFLIFIQKIINETKVLQEVKIEQFIKYYEKQWNSGNPLSPNEIRKRLK